MTGSRARTREPVNNELYKEQTECSIVGTITQEEEMKMSCVIEMEKTTTETETANITEYKFFIDGVPEFIYGRITETLDNDCETPFHLTLSHFCPRGAADASHVPSVCDFQTQQEAHEAMIGYFSGIQTPLSPNASY